MYHAAPKIRYTAKLPCRIGVKKDLKRHVSQKPVKKASKSTVCSGDGICCVMHHNAKTRIVYGTNSFTTLKMIFSLFRFLSFMPL